MMQDKHGMEIHLGDYIQIIPEYKSKGRVAADEDGEWYLDGGAQFYLKNYKPEDLEILWLHGEKEIDNL